MCDDLLGFQFPSIFENLQQSDLNLCLIDTDLPNSFQIQILALNPLELQDFPLLWELLSLLELLSLNEEVIFKIEHLKMTHLDHPHLWLLS